MKKRVTINTYRHRITRCLNCIFMVFTSNINHNNIVKFHFSKALASANLYAVKGVINKSADI